MTDSSMRNGQGSTKSPEIETRPAKVSKYKPRPGRGLQSKVFALEDQMRQVQSSIDDVVSILHRALGPTSTSLQATANLNSPSRAPLAARNSTDSSSSWYLPQHNNSSSQPAPSLEQWVRQLDGVGLPLHPQSSAPPTSSLPPLDKAFPHVGDSIEGDDDDEEEEEEEGLLLMRDMLRKEKSARLRADGHDLTSPRAIRSNIMANQGYGVDLGFQGKDDGSARKRKRSDSSLQQSRSSGRGIPDPIELGMCTEEQGQELFRLFFICAHTFMPVYDSSYDTWTSLRQRSAFSITSILYVGKKIQDAGDEPSELQRRLREHAEEIGKTTLFSPISTIEALQAMIVLASWGDTGWRPGSHALSMALDMELHECLPRLAATTTTPSTAPTDAATIRTLVVGSRLWLMVSKMAIEMAFNHGRPLALKEEDVLPHAHALLHHPSALPTDSRTIAACELLLLRLPLHRLFLAKDNDHLDRSLQVFNEGARAWQARWQEYYLQRGVSQDDLLVTDLTTQRCFSSVLANSRLLRDIRGAADVDRLPPHRRRWLETSLDDARLVVAHILTKEKDKLIHANHYSHVALASVARIYLRLASLLPDIVDLRQTAKDLNRLADVLAHFPGFRFAQQLRRIIGEARKRRVLPPETRPPSPRPYSDAHTINSDIALQQLDPSFGGLSSTQVQTNEESPFDFDVFAAEQLFAEGFGQTSLDLQQSNQHYGQGMNGGLADGENNGWGFALTNPYGGQMQWGSGLGMGNAGQINLLPWLDLPALEMNPSFDFGPASNDGNPNSV